MFVLMNHFFVLTNHPFALMNHLFAHESPFALMNHLFTLMNHHADIFHCVCAAFWIKKRPKM